MADCARGVCFAYDCGPTLNEIRQNAFGTTRLLKSEREGDISMLGCSIYTIYILFVRMGDLFNCTTFGNYEHSISTEIKLKTNKFVHSVLVVKYWIGINKPYSWYKLYGDFYSRFMMKNVAFFWCVLFKQFDFFGCETRKWC